MIDIYADGAELDVIKKYKQLPFIKGFTTNPTLMKYAGVTNYKEFALQAIAVVHNQPISFEVFADDFNEMERQAEEISSWGENVNVKIPITNTKGESSVDLIKQLVKKRIKLNITAIMTKEQVASVAKVLSADIFSITSVFCGRIADTGQDPGELIRFAKERINKTSQVKILWASTREVFNIFQAEKNGCQIITVPHNMLGKFGIIGKNLNEYSIETVKDFYNDAQAAGYKL